MNSERRLSLGLIWSQFAAYHVDRCEAVARRLAGRADVLAIEVATTSADYAWEPSGTVDGARKITLFPGQSFDQVGAWRRFRAMFAATRRCDTVAIGLSYGLPDVIMLSWALRLMGKQVIVFSESKFDDTSRSLGLELFKAAMLFAYSAAIVGARRHLDYFRFLGFRRRRVLPGYDTVGIERIRRQADGVVAPAGTAHADRHFVYIGRFVDKKNLAGLIGGYARYVALAAGNPRRLALVGSGTEDAQLRAQIDELGLAGLIDFPGFLGAAAVSRTLASALALVLVSREEQWGLVVNEALAVGLPAIVSREVGSGDVLIRNLVNGFVVEGNSPDGIARAMLRLAADRAEWERMVAASHLRSWLGDTERLADAVEALLFPQTDAAAGRIAKFLAESEHCYR